MHRQTFADVSFERYCKLTRRERFLNEMNRVVPWAEWVASMVQSPLPWAGEEYQLALYQLRIDEPVPGSPTPVDDDVADVDVHRTGGRPGGGGTPLETLPDYPDSHMIVQVDQPQNGFLSTTVNESDIP